MDNINTNTNTDRLVELGKSFIVNFASALVLALFVVLGTYLAVTYAGMDQVAAVGLITLLATPVYSALPASTVGLTKAFIAFLSGYLPTKKDDQGSTTPIAMVIVGVLALVLVGGVVLVLGFHVDVLAVLSGVGLLVLGFLSSLIVKPGKPVKAWPGVTIRDGRAYIDWDLFDKSRVHVQAIPTGLLEVTFTAGGHVWDARDARFNNEDGYIYSLRIDPTEDNVPAAPNAVYNEMTSLSGAKALDYILGVISEKGVDVATIKATLQLGEKVVGDMKAQGSWQSFLEDRMGDPADGSPWGMTKAWMAHLKRDDYLLRREADDLYWKYYKGA